MNQQLPLQLGWADGYTLANYYAGANRQAVDSLRATATGTGEAFLYLSGTSGVGKSHLLQAACAEAAAHGRHAAYLPLKDSAQFTVQILDGLEQLHLVCIDDLDAVAGHPSWEEGLFDLYNRMREAGRQLVVAATHPSRYLPLHLDDFRSRLAWGLQYQLQPLADEEKLRALQLRAHRRGLELPEETARYLLTRKSRDMAALFTLLERLDRASLSAQRRLTVPFIKNLL